MQQNLIMFKEAAANDGSIDDSKPLKITLSGDTLTGEDGEDFVAAGKVTTNLDDVASGLTAFITRKSPTELTVTLTGNATTHSNAKDLFLKGGFRYSMDILVFIFFLLYVGYCRGCVRHLGEVIISYPQAVIQAREHRHSVKKELAILIIHGVLHLLEYDHEKPEMKHQMNDREKKILSQVALTE